ncbi:MAG: glycosyltransferase family 39 protein [Neisseriaceae bacterium]|nr:MAG: glycosyltransferase family 39 protein [Neisseriaceae bacterium]
MQNRNFIIVLMAWFIILTGFCFTIFPYQDSFYYWTWSQKLQLSYYDGPPLIAYTLRFFTQIFGNTVFSINFLGVISAYLSAYYIFKISKALNDSTKVAQFATILFLTYPFVTTRFIYNNMTYDCLENLCYIIISYYIILFLLTRKYNYWLLIGFFSGLAMLSKYSAVVLFLAIFIFFISYGLKYKIFMHWQLYAGILICLIMFFPVIYWNYINDWISFKYQLNSHKWIGEVGSINSSDKYGLPGMWFYILNCIMATYHILILILAIALIKYKYKPLGNIGERFLFILFLVFILFWLYISYSSHVGLNYALPVVFVLIYFVAKFLAGNNLNKVFSVLILSFSVISIGMMVDHSLIKNGNINNYNKFIKSGLIKQPLQIWSIPK